MSTWTGINFLGALRTALGLRAGLTGVAIFTADPGDDLQRESIVLHSVRARQDDESMNKGRRDEYSAFGFIWIWKPGAGQTVIASAQDRVEAILSEIETELKDNHTLDGLVLHAEMVGIDLVQGIEKDGRAARADFEIAVMAVHS